MAHLFLNQQRYALDHYRPQQTLLQFLRQAGLVGTKEGCGDGDCGACTVALCDHDARGNAHFKAINSCLVPLGSLADRHLVSVEGLADAGLHPVQEAMINEGGSQCGYCTPGFIMSMFAGYYDQQLSDSTIEGNLCRCTGYLPIQRAMASLNTSKPADHFSDFLASQAVTISTSFIQHQDHIFLRPSSLAECFEQLEHYPEATFVAGGTDIGLELSQFSDDYPQLISLEHIQELQHLSVTEETVTIGAAIPLSHLKTTLKGIFPALDEMLSWFAATQIRNRATLGGNLATASPIGDLAPVLLALDAHLHLRDAEGSRELAIADFFQAYRQTSLAEHELIEAISIPRVHLRRLSFSYKVGKRGTDDISIVAAAFTIDLNQDQHICHARLAYGGVAATPIRALAVEQWLLGQPWQLATIQEAKTMLSQSFTPLSDLRASASYRTRLISNLFEKFYDAHKGTP